MFATLGDKVTFAVGTGKTRRVLTGKVVEREAAGVSVEALGAVHRVTPSSVLRVKAAREDRFARLPWKSDLNRLPWHRSAA